MILKGEFGWGAAEGKVWRLRITSPRVVKITAPQQTSEQVLKLAFQHLIEELKREKQHLKKGKQFLDFPLSVLQDPQLWNAIQEFLDKGAEPGQAVVKAFRKWENAFKKLDDSYLRLRIQDLQDLRQRLLIRLGAQPSGTVPDEPFIAVGKDLYVTDFLQLQRSRLQGIALEEGNESAHGVMLAKAIGVPLVGKVKGLLAKAREGDFAILSRDKVYIDESSMSFRAKRGISFSEKQILRPLKRPQDDMVRKFITKDKVPITVRANLQLAEEIDKAKIAGAMGVGLFRTEFLWMGKSLSAKEEAGLYRDAMEAFHPWPVVFRLADLGSDKPYGKINWPEEKNPALGWRGLRFLLDRPEILHKQLQALFPAAGEEELHLLLPMVRTPEEIDEFLEMLKPFTRKHKTKVKIGIMIETPSCVELINRLPKVISFVSLGTNDLHQYFFAVDRVHPKIKVESVHPSFLRYLNEVLQKCRRAKKTVSLCGEMAGDPKALPILLGLGLREFSVSVSRIPEVSRSLSRLSIRDSRKLTQKCLKAQTSREVRKLLVKK